MFFFVQTESAPPPLIASSRRIFELRAYFLLVNPSARLRAK